MAMVRAHTGHFPAKTFSGTFWLLQLRHEDSLTTLTVTGLSTILVVEWMDGVRGPPPVGLTVRRGVSAKLLNPFGFPRRITLGAEGLPWTVYGIPWS